MTRCSKGPPDDFRFWGMEKTVKIPESHTQIAYCILMILPAILHNFGHTFCPLISLKFFSAFDKYLKAQNVAKFLNITWCVHCQSIQKLSIFDNDAAKNGF